MRPHEDGNYSEYELYGEKELIEVMEETDLALNALYERAVLRLEQIEIQMNATGQASPGAISEIRNYLHCSKPKPESDYLKSLRGFIEETQKLADDEKRRIVCAAVRMKDGTIFPGVRHYSPDMRLMITLAGYSGKKLAGAEDGFVDQWGCFLTRQEAFAVALRQRQYAPYPPYAIGTLYSEDLY